MQKTTYMPDRIPPCGRDARLPIVRVEKRGDGEYGLGCGQIIHLVEDSSEL